MGDPERYWLGLACDSSAGLFQTLVNLRHRFVYCRGSDPVIPRAPFERSIIADANATVLS